MTDEISIKLKSRSSITYLENKYGIKFARETSYGSYIFKTTDWSKTLDIANKIYENETAAVTWSHPNFLFKLQFHSDPLYTNQYYLNNTGQLGGTAGIDINAPEAWNSTKGCGVRVAVIDQGVDAHEEFGARLLPGKTVGSNDTQGAPISGGTEGNSKNHGVACAGIIAAAHDNSLGIKGIAPNSYIVPVNISPDNNSQGFSSPEIIATAMEWAWNQGQAAVLSCSWGGGMPNQDISLAIEHARTSGRGGKGSVVVFSSGNGNPNDQVSFPASVNGVVTVGAIDKNGGLWGFSNGGPELDLVAPTGNTNLTGDVTTTDRVDQGATVLGWATGNYTNLFGGTSAAAPQASGVAALILSINPNLTEAQVLTILQNSATDMGPGGFDNDFGFGRLNAQAAVAGAIASLHWSISGASPVCSQVRPNTGTTFTFNNLPSAATISWTKSSNLTEVSGQGTASYKVKASSVSTSGAGWVTATVSLCGGTLDIITYNVWVGRPYDFVVSGPASMLPGATSSFSISLWGGQPSFSTQGVLSTGFTWTFGMPSTAAGWSCNGCTGQNVSITAGGQSTYVTGNVTNVCGTTTRDQPVHVERTDCPPGGCEEPFLVSPNPGSDELLIAPASTDNASTSISIANSSGDVIYSMESIGKEEVKIPVRNYLNGNYFISITRDNKTTKHQVVIRH
ncbi:MAG: S8 family serine peptidase [Bacteroidota bacterium]